LVVVVGRIVFNGIPTAIDDVYYLLDFAAGRFDEEETIQIE
jgi:hypothetical protein